MFFYFPPRIHTIVVLLGFDRQKNEIIHFLLYNKRNKRISTTDIHLYSNFIAHHSKSTTISPATDQIKSIQRETLAGRKEVEALSAAGHATAYIFYAMFLRAKFIKLQLRIGRTIW